MTRPCFLVVDREHAGNISTRKLIPETAKLNVITAYSGAEALETFERFPKVDGFVVGSGTEDVPCADLVKRLKSADPELLVIVVGRPYAQPCAGGDHLLKAFELTKL